MKSYPWNLHDDDDDDDYNDGNDDDETWAVFEQQVISSRTFCKLEMKHFIICRDTRGKIWVTSKKVMT